MPFLQGLEEVTRAEGVLRVGLEPSWNCAGSEFSDTAVGRWMGRSLEIWGETAPEGPRASQET